jgi:predicted N-acetyltransferase YhbS
MPHIVPLSAIDPKLVEDLLDLAFEPERRTRTAYRIREGTEWLPALSFAALDDEEYLVATIQLWPVALTDAGGTARPLVMVGPVAVLPAFQGEGYGKALIAAALAALDPASPIPQVLIGDAPYYERFGFYPAPRGWTCPGPWDPDRLLVRDLHADFPSEGMLGPWPASGLAN